MTTRKHSFFRRHSLSIVCSLILLCWIVLYSQWNPDSHWGAFFGNAIADWTGLVVTVLATKYMYEIGSAESRKPPHRFLAPVWEKLRDHSLSIFLLITGIGWTILFAHSDSRGDVSSLPGALRAAKQAVRSFEQVSLGRSVAL